jgi:polysaccharide export outer membrane protein
MKFYRSKFFYLSILVVLIILFSTSCVPMKKIKYLQSEVKKGDAVQTTFEHKKSEDFKIQPGDNLYIRVNNALSTTENIFSLDQESRSSNYYNDVGIYLNSYRVSDSGYIDFPFVGKVFLKDHTLEQAQELLQSIVDDYLKGTTVIVRLAIFKVTMLGEFNRPGEYSVYESKFNIFDAIAQAGDLTTFAKRNKIYLVRQTESGSKVVHLDLNDIGILESEYYTIMPNDIIYAQPVKGKNFAFREFPYSLIFTTISTTLLLINFFKTN